MARMIAYFRGEQIVVTDRPSCPYCHSRRHIDGPVGFACTQEPRRPDGSGPKGKAADVWSCLCPTLRRRVFFGVLRVEIEDETGPGWEPIDFAPLAVEVEKRDKRLSEICAMDREAQ